ncbi:hypothetical protein C8J57DRAFT_1274328 [Mycena rebaudengoi]|nr:hypothetical protein C8J57DRAFT_1274328 [Mycena rebaudengoi]
MTRTSNSSSAQKRSSGRPKKASAAQKNTDENRADDAAKRHANKERQQKAASKKAQRASNDNRAEVLQNTTNTVPAPVLSADEQIAVLTARLKAADDKAGVRALAVEAKVDFESKWSAQEPAVIAKVLRVAAERYPYLTARRFPRSWATSAILQRYINNVRTYSSGKMNPDSGVSRRRQKLTKIGRLEANTRMQEHQSSPRRSLSPSAPNNEMDVDVDNAGGHNDRDDDGDGSDGQTSVNDMDDGFGSDASADLDGELSVLSD